MKIKKIGILMIAGTLMCTSPAATVMASDATETVQEIITDNEIDSLVSDGSLCLYLHNSFDICSNFFHILNKIPS